MHRLGFEEKDMNALTAFIQNNSCIMIKSVFSHLAAAEDAGEDDFTNLQAEKFLQCCHAIQSVLHYSFLKHIANSAATARNSNWQFDMVRVGIGLYGVESANQHLNLQPVASLKKQRLRNCVAYLRAIPWATTGAVK